MLFRSVAALQASSAPVAPAGLAARLVPLVLAEAQKGRRKGVVARALRPVAAFATAFGVVIGSLAAAGGALVVSADGRTITGIVSERDVVRALSRGTEVLDLPVASIMTTAVYCAPLDTHIDELMHLMTAKRIRHIPVVDDEIGRAHV